MARLFRAGIEWLSAAVGDDIIRSKIGAESTARLTINADGKHEWGDGTAAADVFLSRSAANTLTIDNSLVPPADDSGSIGTNALAFLSGYFNQLYGDGLYRLGDASARYMKFRPTGTPEAAATGSVGAAVLRLDGGPGTTLYVKEVGTGTSGWQAISSERALTMGVAGTISATMTDTADFIVPVPFNMTLKRMKVTAKTAPTGSMVVTARKSTNAATPSWSDITGFTLTYTANETTDTVDPTDQDIDEGNLINFSIGTGSGANVLVELIGVTR